MKTLSIFLTFFLMLSFQQARAADAHCLEKIQSCKEVWQSLNPEKLTQEVCDKCSTVCALAQQECKSQTKNHLQTANAYHLGCKKTCSAKSR